MEGVADGNGAGCAPGRALEIASVMEEEAEMGFGEAAGAPTNGAPASFELASKPSRRAPKRQTNLWVK